MDAPYIAFVLEASNLALSTPVYPLSVLAALLLETLVKSPFWILKAPFLELI